jgi:hypothetical protein
VPPKDGWREFESTAFYLAISRAISFFISSLTSSDSGMTLLAGNQISLPQLRGATDPRARPIEFAPNPAEKSISVGMSSSFGDRGALMGHLWRVIS